MQAADAILDKIADIVLTYRTPDKMKKLAAKAKRVEREKEASPQTAW
jgi:hypothetical protein